MSGDDISRRDFVKTSAIAATVASAASAPAGAAKTGIMPRPEDLAKALNNDGEFRLMSRYWNGGVRIDMESETFQLSIIDGEASAEPPKSGDVIHLAGPDAAFQALLLPTPPRFFNDIAPLTSLGVERKSDGLFYAQYYPALARLFEVARPDTPTQNPMRDTQYSHGDHDTPVGRYVHLNLADQDYRIYYEEAGQGIPLLLQHTAGSHGTQWRHLFEYPEITKKFRLIAYDLPYHGKSVPPVGKEWWSEQYKLTGEFLRSVPIQLSKALGLDNPVFMGCSVGGVLALDLAYHHPEAFRAVISVEGALNIPGDVTDETHQMLYHPQVSNEFKGRAMHSLTAPTSPEPYRRETIQTYKAGWPQAFIGDLFYYADEYDLTDKAQDIDTNKIAVHIMNGEYDFSGSWELGELAHQAIKGSTWTKMDGIGHFPMSEDPEAFVAYLKPILDSIDA